MQDFFEHYFDFDGLHTKYARSLPSVSGEEFHNYYEFIFFLGGKARFISKSIHKDLKIGTVIYVPKNSFHQFIVDDGDYTRFILKFRERRELNTLLESLGIEPVMIEDPSDTLTILKEGLINLSKSSRPPNENRLYLEAAVIHLLFEFQKVATEVGGVDMSVSKTVRDALLLIDKIYTSPTATVKEIAKELHTSESLLAHKFRTETNISVYKYITKKRLATARDLIQSGIKITAASEQSGFPDYSSFYRLYKKQYGCMPSVQDEYK